MMPCPPGHRPEAARPVRSKPRRPPRPELRLGPVLLARGTQGGRWRVSCCMLFRGDAEPADLRVEGVSLPVPPRFLAEWSLDGGATERLWRYDFAVPRGVQDGRAGYGLDGDERRWHFALPGTLVPPRIAFASCGGCEDEAAIAAAGLSRNARWGHLLGRHRAEPFHLLLLGGDQVYADGLWQGVDGLAATTAARRGSAPLPPDLPARLDRWYLEVYRHGWSQPETAAVLASVPALCMWDDHDILDGWGSHPDAVLESAPYRAVFAAARKAFRLFQLGMADDPPETLLADPGTGVLSQGLTLNGVGVLALDLRSERRPDRVMSETTWKVLPGWLDRYRGARHLLLMSGVPVLFPGLGLAERILNLIPGRQRLEDDLRDQWRSPAHREEWTRLLRLLAGFVRETRCRVTVVSGEVHLGGVGVLRGLDLEIWQLISSGIVHPPPAGFAVDVLERLAGRREPLADGLTLEFPGFAETGRRLLPARNWLSLTGRPDGALEAEWHAEGAPAPLRLTLPTLF